MFGWLSILARYGLFKETIRVFLQALRKHKSGLYENIKAEVESNDIWTAILHVLTFIIHSLNTSFNNLPSRQPGR